MRKLAVVSAALTVALVFAAVAYAANVYQVTPASTTPAGKGTPAKPVAKKVKFGFKAEDSTGARATPIEKYSIQFQGLKSFARFFPKCKFSQADSDTLHLTKCRKAKVGSGKVQNRFGGRGRPDLPGGCPLNLVLYNLGDGFAIRLDGGSTAEPPTSCPIQVNQAIRARFVSKRVDGKSGVALNFTVPSNLRHPGSPEIDNSVASVSSTVSGKTRRVRIRRKLRRVSILSSVGCGARRTISVVFTDEAGDAVGARKKTRC